MKIRYDRPENSRRRERSPGRREDRSPRARRREGVRFAQLCLSVALFLVVFLGKNLAPVRSGALLGRMQSAITANADVGELVRRTGQALQSGQPVAQVWAELFPGQEAGQTSELPQGENILADGAHWEAERWFLVRGGHTAQELYEHYIPSSWEGKQLELAQPVQLTWMAVLVAATPLVGACAGSGRTEEA